MRSRSSSAAAAPALGIAAGTQTLGELGADLHGVVGGGILEGLQVGVDGQEFDAGQPGFDHAADGVAAGSADCRPP